MRLLSALLALLIALSVGAAPLPGAFGVAYAGAANVEHRAGAPDSEAACAAADARHGDHGARSHAVGDLCADAGGGLDQAGCCEMAMCHPFLLARAMDARFVPPVAIAAARRIETCLNDERSTRIERPPRA